MICILKLKGGEIVEWLIAHDLPEARRIAQVAGNTELAQYLYRIEAGPVQPGKYALPTGHFMLVQQALADV